MHTKFLLRRTSKHETQKTHMAILRLYGFMDAGTTYSFTRHTELTPWLTHS